jgi:endoglucanase
MSTQVADDATIRTAVDLWLSDRAAAEATYGHISKWVTGGVTDMSYLFCAPLEDDDEDEDEDGKCHPAAAAFNEDISAWDTSGVVTMSYLFYGAAAFNQTISGWRVEKGHRDGLHLQVRHGLRPGPRLVLGRRH